jgi:hypothetical protein
MVTLDRTKRQQTCSGLRPRNFGLALIYFRRFIADDRIFTDKLRRPFERLDSVFHFDRRLVPKSVSVQQMGVTKQWIVLIHIFIYI